MQLPGSADSKLRGVEKTVEDIGVNLQRPLQIPKDPSDLPHPNGEGEDEADKDDEEEKDKEGEEKSREVQEEHQVHYDAEQERLHIYVYIYIIYIQDFGGSLRIALNLGLGNA